MQYLSQSFKLLTNLTSLDLDLPSNNLGENQENLRFLGEGIK